MYTRSARGDPDTIKEGRVPRDTDRLHRHHTTRPELYTILLPGQSFILPALHIHPEVDRITAMSTSPGGPPIIYREPLRRI